MTMMTFGRVMTSPLIVLGICVLVALVQTSAGGEGGGGGGGRDTGKEDLTPLLQPPSSRQSKRTQAMLMDPLAVRHLSAKRLQLLEHELTRRQQTLPEHRLYHLSLLIRRLKTLLHHRRPAPPQATSSTSSTSLGGEAPDGWQEELRIRRELADRAAQYGLDMRMRRRARVTQPDPEHPHLLTLMERIHRDAQEILRRRAQEKSGGKGQHDLKEEEEEKVEEEEKETRHHRHQRVVRPLHGEEEEEEGKGRRSGGGAKSVQRMTQDSQHQLSLSAATLPVSSAGTVLKNGSAVVASPPPTLNARQRRKMKHRNRALVRVLNRQKKLNV